MKDNTQQRILIQDILHKSKDKCFAIINEYTTLKPNGKAHEWVGLCPFHQEKTPSFCYNDETTQQNCFGCTWHGDIFSFLQKKKGLKFQDSLQILADYAGVDTKTASKPRTTPRGCRFFRCTIRDMQEEYAKEPDDFERQRVKQYFNSRNIPIDDELIRELRIRVDHPTNRLWMPRVDPSGQILQSWHRLLTPQFTKLDGQKGAAYNHKQKGIENPTAIRISRNPKDVVIFEGIEDALTYYYLQGKELEQTILACCSDGNFPKMKEFCQDAEKVTVYLDGDLSNGQTIADYPCYSAPSVQFATKLLRELPKDVCTLWLPAEPKTDMNKAHCNGKGKEWLNTLLPVPVEIVIDYTLELVTQYDCAEKFAELCGALFRYDHKARCWMYLDNNWRKDETDKLLSQVRRYLFDASIANAKDAKTAQTREMRKHAYVKAVAESVTLIEDMKRTEWDTDILLLGTPGQTIDLRTGKQRPASASDYITKQTLVEPAQGTPRLWLKFLGEVTQGDAELMRYLQKLAGYSLTGSTVEHALIFLYGQGKNGKSTFFETLLTIFNDYAAMASMGAFMESRGNEAGKAAPEIMRLEGLRLVVCNETNEGVYWHESKVKALVSGEPFTGRRLYQEEKTFTPRFTPWVIGNNKPNLRHVDEAMRRRLHLIPFLFQVDKPDKHLKEKLLKEAPQILQWCIDGCLLWQSEGLEQPKAVKQATDSYFEDQDTVTEWKDACLDFGKVLSATPTQLLESYNDFTGEKADHKKINTIMKKMELSGLRIAERRTVKGKKWEGVAVRLEQKSYASNGYKDHEDYDDNEANNDLPF